ncbi:ATP-dependent permease [Zalaria obscura]|uniref:ATP-dependent permease n=1 Tax=Zalaria obscura TaxID=2024903 RepID=A0ACC3S4P8_9PEZI
MPALFGRRRAGKTSEKEDDHSRRHSVNHDLAEKGAQPVDADEENPQRAPWKALFFFTTKAHLAPLSIAIICAIASGVASPAQSLLMGKAFNAFESLMAGTIDKSELFERQTKYALYFVGIGCGSWLLHFLFFTFWLAFGELQAKSARDRLFMGLLERDVEWYDMRKNGIGALIPRLQTQTRELQLATSQPLGTLITSAATACFNLGLALYYSWKLTLVVISTIPLIAGLVVYFGGLVQRNFGKQQAKLSEALKYVTSALNAIETVKCFNGQEIEKEKYSKIIGEAAQWYYRTAHVSACQMGITVLLGQLMFVQGFYYGGTLVTTGQKTTGDVVTTFFSAMQAFQSVQSILPQLIVLEKGRTAGATLRAMMAQVYQGPAVTRTKGLKQPAHCKGSITVKNLSFAYPARPDQMALKNVSLFIPAGDLTFIIGKSGSGKSTLGQLLMRFYPPALGDIQLDAQSLSDLDPTWLRSKITLVEQHSTLFNETVFENIALGKDDYHRVTKVEVEQAAEFALLQLMITDMPDGLDTLVGSKGGSMSGGQRQRMALARAWLRNTSILLLDESTSALDPISRTLMMDAIRQWRKGRTTIIITHDIEQIQADDYAYVFQNGKLVQEGYRKHMERLKDTPFQSFLAPDEQAQISPFDARKHTSLDLSTMEQSFTEYEPRKHPPIAHDPLEAHLAAAESPRISFLPGTLLDKNTSPALGSAYAFGGFAGVTKSPFLRFSGVPSLSPTSPRSSGSDNQFRWSMASRSEAASKQAKRSSRWSTNGRAELMEKLMDRTGNFAAQARSGMTWSRRPRPSSDSSVPRVKTLGSRIKKRKKRTPAKIKSTPGPAAPESLKAILNTVWPSLNWGDRVALVVGFLGAGVHAAVTPVFSYITSKLVQTYSMKTGAMHEALKYSLVIIGLSVVDSIACYSMRMFLEYAAQRWTDSIRREAMERVLDQPKNFFMNEDNSASRITEALDRHAEEMRNILGRFAGGPSIQASSSA